MVKFSYVDNSNTYRGELLYIANEGTLFFAPFSPQANYSVMIAGAYLSLDVDLRSGEAKHISGYNSKHLWRNMALQKPHATRGKLFVLFDSQAIVGAGEYYSTGWATYFDKINNTICIGNPNIIDCCDCVEFADGIIAVLQKDQLLAIWATIREIDSWCLSQTPFIV